MTLFDQFPLALLSLPLISALIGWVTNYVAIKMLFHPRKPLKLGFFTVQGILPRRQADIAIKLGRIVATDLLSSEQLINRLTNENSRAVYQDFIDTQAETFIHDKLFTSVPLAKMFLRPKRVEKLKAALVVEIIDNLPQLVERLTNQNNGALDVQQLVEEQVRGFSTDRLEKLLHDILAKEFRFIEALGAILGFLIGIVQMLWIFLMV